jgi:hypothetical protein
MEGVNLTKVSKVSTYGNVTMNLPMQLIFANKNVWGKKEEITQVKFQASLTCLQINQG